MYVFIFYLVALVASCLFLVRFGGTTGRRIAVVIFSLSLVSAGLSMTASNYAALQPRMLAVDVISLLLKIAIAVASTRRWPIWLAAFQFNTVLAESAVMLSPAFRSDFYYAMATFWAVPTIAVAVGGTIMDRRSERKNAR